MNYWKGIGVETGYNPVLKILGTSETVSKYKGQDRISYSYKMSTNKYYDVGVVYRVFSYNEFENIQKWQNETGIQVIYPYVEPESVESMTIQICGIRWMQRVLRCLMRMEILYLYIPLILR